MPKIVEKSVLPPMPHPSPWYKPVNPPLTSGTQGDEGLSVLSDQGQLLLLLGQLAQDVFNEVVRGDCGQVPLQLTQHHKFPLLQRAGGRGLSTKNP